MRVPFSYTDRLIRQRRPALVIAESTQGVPPGLLWVLMITSAAHRRWPGDVEVSDLAEAGLPAPSIVRSAKIATIEIASATLMGCLPEADRAAVAGHVSPLLAAMLNSLAD